MGMYIYIYKYTHICFSLCINTLLLIGTSALAFTYACIDLQVGCPKWFHALWTIASDGVGHERTKTQTRANNPPSLLTVLRSFLGDVPVRSSHAASH